MWRSGACTGFGGRFGRAAKAHALKFDELLWACNAPTPCHPHVQVMVPYAYWCRVLRDRPVPTSWERPPFVRGIRALVTP